MKKINWIASYPKSGNTWVRAIIYLAIHGNVDLNKLGKLVPSFSHPVDLVLKQKNRKLKVEKISEIWDDAQLLSAKKALTGGVLIKTHNACGEYHGRVFPSAKYTNRAVYIVRNPGDVAVSYANHYQQDLDFSVKRLLSDDNFITSNNSENYFEFLSSWNIHVQSWMSQKFPVHLVRYEDLKQRPHESVREMLRFLGIRPVINIEKIIELSTFKRFHDVEIKSGFKEAVNRQQFFKTGEIGMHQEPQSSINQKFAHRFPKLMATLNYR